MYWHMFQDKDKTREPRGNTYPGAGEHEEKLEITTEPGTLELWSKGPICTTRVEIFFFLPLKLDNLFDPVLPFD